MLLSALLLLLLLLLASNYCVVLSVSNAVHAGHDYSYEYTAQRTACTLFAVALLT